MTVPYLDQQHMDAIYAGWEAYQASGDATALISASDAGQQSLTNQADTVAGERGDFSTILAGRILNSRDHFGDAVSGAIQSKYGVSSDAVGAAYNAPIKA
jgi:hypothetical protein